MKLTEHIFRENIRNHIRKILKESDDDIDWDLYELFDQVKWELMDEFITAVKKEKPNAEKGKYLKARQKWEVIPLSTLKRQWEEYMKYGYVKPNYIQTIEGIEKIITQNIAKVNVNTELAGHTQHDPKNDWREYLQDQMPHDKLEKYVKYLDDNFGEFILEPHGQYRLSDYGLEKLNKGLSELRKANTPEKKLTAIDHILSVVHMRSDIAAWFVEGGSSGLASLSGNDRGN